MTTSVRVLSSSSVDSSPSILLVASDGTKILVNCGEGCQRCFLEYGQRLSTVTTVLICEIHPDAIGGLPGMILTTADASAAAEASAILLRRADGVNGKGIQEDTSAHPSHPDAASLPSSQSGLSGLQIVGPTGTKQFIHSLRHFMRRDKFLVTAHEGATDTPLPVYLSRGRNRSAAKKNKNGTNSGSSVVAAEVGFTVQSLAVSLNDTTTNDDVERCQPKVIATRKHPRDNNDEESSQRRDRVRQALSFIIHTPPVQGKFLAQRAMELGVPKGPLYAKLKAGNSVSFLDATSNVERTVHSAEVVEPATPAVVVLVLYYPNAVVAARLFALDALISAVDSISHVVELVVHLAPRELFQAIGLPFWKDRSTVEHVWLSTLHTDGIDDGTPFHSASQGAKARSLLCPSVYTLPRSIAATDKTTLSTREYRIGQATMEYTLIPRCKRGFNALSLRDKGQDDKDVEELIDTTGALAAARDILAASRLQESSKPASGEVLFTGTGSAMPCKHRNVTGMLLKQVDGRSMVLDVGEGTIGQLMRAETSDDTESVLASIKAVWISHPHADHHLGLLRLLTDRVSDDAVLLLAPAPIFRFLEEYADVDPSIQGSYHAIDASLLVESNAAVQEKVKAALGVSGCRSIPVAHCAHAYALILEGTSFGRVVYSGDCRPSFQLAQAAIGADLLIHEATFEDGMEAEAALKKHSTIGEALSISRAMQCQCTVLTHFSQRYPKIPPTPAGEYNFPIIFAFDFMRLQPHNLLLASKMTPALRLLFPETRADDKDIEGSVASRVLSVPGVFAMPKLL